MNARSPGRLFGFLKSTIVGGIFVLMPVVLLSMVIGKALQVVYRVVQPVVDLLPVRSVGTISLGFVVAVAAIVLSCFVAGLLARTTVLQWFVGSLEQLILSFVPGYGLMKSMGQGWVGVEADGPNKPVLVRLDDASQIGFVMDTLPDGRQVVFIPDVPTPWSGSLLIVTADRLEPLAMSTKHTIDCLKKLGARTSQLMVKAQTP